MKSVSILACAALTFVATACDSTQPKHSGTLTAVLASPNGPEGAAVLDVSGPVDTVTAVEGTQLFQTPTATGKRIILVRLAAGELSMRVAVPDVGSLPQISVVEVADGDNKIRQSTSGYTVSFK